MAKTHVNAQGKFELSNDLKGVTLSPRFAWAYARRADAYAGKGEYEAAAADREKAQELQP